jgi:hypothetical protein
MHRDAHVVNHVDDVFDLLGIDDPAREVIVDFCVGEVALLLAAGDQVLELLGLLVPANHRTLFAQDREPPSKKCKRLSIRF